MFFLLLFLKTHLSTICGLPGVVFVFDASQLTGLPTSERHAQCSGRFDHLCAILCFWRCVTLIVSYTVPASNLLPKWFDKPICASSSFSNLAISSGISYSRLITWSCVILWRVIYPEEQIVDKIKDKQAAFARAFVPGPGLPSLLGEISR